MFNALCKLVEDLERRPSLYEPYQLRERIEALDPCDIFNLDMMPPDPESTVAAVYQCARAIHARLEAANLAVYDAVRRDVRSGDSAHSLRDWVPSSDACGPAPGLERDQAYDFLDEFLDG